MTDMRFDPARPIAIIGGGVMGTKVAWACARAGIPTRLYDIDAAQCTRALANARSWGTGAERDRVAANLATGSDLDAALAVSTPKRVSSGRLNLANVTRGGHGRHYSE